MRSLTSVPILVLSLLLCWSSPAIAEDGNGDEPEEEAEESEAVDRDEAIRQAWSQFFAPPEDHRWELEAGAGLNFWQTAYRGRLGQNYGRLRLRRLWSLPIGTSLGVDFSRRTPRAGPIDFRTDRMAITSAAGLHWWSGRWLLGADLEAGILLHRRTIDDATGEAYSTSQLKPLAGTAARAGVSIYGISSLTMELGMRWHPDRIDRLLIFQLAWLF